MRFKRWMVTMMVTGVLVMASIAAAARGDFFRPIPGYTQEHFAAGDRSWAPPGLVWQVFDVSGTVTGEPDLLAYNPATGDYILAVTDHYQFSGPDGIWTTPGDCYVMGRFEPGLVLTVSDLDRNGQPDLFAYHPITGNITRYYFRNIGRCDWTTAF